MLLNHCRCRCNAHCFVMPKAEECVCCQKVEKVTAKMDMYNESRRPHQMYQWAPWISEFRQDAWTYIHWRLLISSTGHCRRRYLIRVFDYVNMACISHQTFHKHQERYIIPMICGTWKQQQGAILMKLKLWSFLLPLLHLGNDGLSRVLCCRE